eukprot:scaffold250096_cov28-Tisochrysis_lutea.AAC.1
MSFQRARHRLKGTAGVMYTLTEKDHGPQGKSRPKWSQRGIYGAEDNIVQDGVSLHWQIGATNELSTAVTRRCRTQECPQSRWQSKVFKTKSAHGAPRTFGRSILGGLLLEEGLVDMGDHTTTRNGRLRVQDNWARRSASFPPRPLPFLPKPAQRRVRPRKKGEWGKAG